MVIIFNTNNQKKEFQKIMHNLNILISYIIWPHFQYLWKIMRIYSKSTVQTKSED
jgi:hypothetical protein